MLPLFWLRVALSLYGVGLLYALASFWGGRKVLTRITLPAVGLGMVFHFVSIIENAMFSGTWTPTSMHGLESLLAFVLMVFFFHRLCPIPRHFTGFGGFSAGFLAHIFSIVLC